MDSAPSPSLVTSEPSPSDRSNPTVENENNPKPINRKKKKRVFKDTNTAEPSPSSSSSVTAISSMNKSSRMAYQRRSSKVVFAPVRRRGSTGNGDVEAIALPLGMSFAAVVAQVLDGKGAAGKRMSVDHLSMLVNHRDPTNIEKGIHHHGGHYILPICTSAVRESLANVFGDKFDFFAGNFQRSFQSTLSTLRLINESSIDRTHPLIHQNLENSASDRTLGDRVECTNSGCMKDSDPETDLPTPSTQGQTHVSEEVEENVSVGSLHQELALHRQTNQLASSPWSRGSSVNMFGTIERSVLEQGRSNDLKALEIGLTMKRLKLEEDMLALTSESNYLERSKLVIGMSKASFKADKFKTQLEETRLAELHRKCIDCLVTGLFIMSASLSYGTYVYSYRRIKEAAASCSLSHKGSKFGWFQPFSSFNSWLQILVCEVQAVIQMAFGILIILAVAFLLVQRSLYSHRTMPITFILLLLGAVCGFTGKLCVDTLGGSGLLWLLYWEALCLLQFFSNVCTPTLFRILHGPITISEGTKPKTLCPYWCRQSLFYVISLLFLPLCCGLLPFAGFGEWKDHFLFGKSEHNVCPDGGY